MKKAALPTFKVKVERLDYGIDKWDIQVIQKLLKHQKY